MNVNCPHCKNALSIEAPLAGQRYSCCLCQGAFILDVCSDNWDREVTPFCNAKLRDWFFPEHGTYPEFPTGVATAGSGPFDEADFDLFLGSRGIQIYSLGSTSGALVLGRTGWDPTTLDAHIEGLRGTTLRVYSQEMFLAYLGRREDPHEDADLLTEFGRGHPGLQHLLMWGFQWPTTDVVPGVRHAERGISEPWPTRGLLSHMGYRVGTNGESVIRRRNILRKVFTESLPNVQSAEYMAEWGSPGSVQRLSKLANAVAAFARNGKRKADPPEEAIRDWEDDLAWLKATFYNEGCYFPWPAIHAYS